MSVPSGFLSSLFVRKSVVFSGSILLLYDYLLTLPLEVQYIWKAPWTPVKAGFLLNRYGNVIGQTFIMLEEAGLLNPQSQHFCRYFRLFLTLFTVASAESIRILVLMRAWAVWGCRYGTAVFLIWLFILYVLAVLGTVIYSQASAPSRPFQYLDQIGVCVNQMPPRIWLMWMAALLLDSTVLIMVWYSLQKFIRESHGLYPSPLIRLLVRDAGIFYAVSLPDFMEALTSTVVQTSLFNSVFSIVCWTIFRQDPTAFLSIAISLPLLSVVGQRLILNLRGFRAQVFTTRDISREIDRQVELMGDALWPDRMVDIEQSHLEQTENSCTSGTTRTGTAMDPVELTEVERGQGEPR